MKKTVATFSIVVSMVICLASHSLASEGVGFSLRSPVDLENLSMEGVESPETVRKAVVKAGSSSPWEKKSAGAILDNPNLTRTTWEMDRPPYGAYDRIALHRIVNNGGNDRRRPRKTKVIFMLPGTWDAGGLSELTDPAINPMLYLASNGYDVYTMSFRSFFLPNMAYEQFDEFGLDISGTGDWTYAVFREDIKACVDKIKKISKAKKIFMSGFSRGAQQMYIYASEYQEDLKGLITFDGLIKAFPPLPGTAVDEETYNYVIYALKAGVMPVPPSCTNILCPPQGSMYQLLGEATWDYYESWQLAAVVPNAQNMVGEALPPDFSTVSDFVAADAQYLWEDGIFSNYSNNTIDRETLITAMAEFTRYWPTVQNFESWQLDAWEDAPYFDYDDNEIDLPAIGFLTRLFCPEGVCLADGIPNKTINDDVTIHYLPDYGHIDILFGSDSLADVKQPLLQWLNDHR